MKRLFAFRGLGCRRAGDAGSPTASSFLDPNEILACPEEKHGRELMPGLLHSGSTENARGCRGTISMTMMNLLKEHRQPATARFTNTKP